MTRFINDIVKTDSITSTLSGTRNRSIRNIMNIVEASDLNIGAKKKIREVVLDEINGFYNQTIQILTYVQEKNGSFK